MGKIIHFSKQPKAPSGVLGDRHYTRFLLQCIMGNEGFLEEKHLRFLTWVYWIRLTWFRHQENCSEAKFITNDGFSFTMMVDMDSKNHVAIENAILERKHDGIPTWMDTRDEHGVPLVFHFEVPDDGGIEVVPSQEHTGDTSSRAGI